METEKIHAGLYEKALEDPEGLAETEYHVCAVCGYATEDGAPDKCPLCGANKAPFMRLFEK